MIYETQKEPFVKWLLENPEYKSVLIFASTREKVRQLGKDLIRAGLPVKAFHSDLEQAEREQILRNFKSRQLRVLVGTDVLSRGIDVEGISLVINYDAPPDPEDYVHRIGRTARAERSGTAITLVNDKDREKFARIEAFVGDGIQKKVLPEQFGSTPPFKNTPGKNFRSREKRHYKK